MAKRGKNKTGFWIIIGIIILVIILVIGLRLYLVGIALEPSSSEPLLSPSPASVKDSDGGGYAAALTAGCVDLYEDGSCGKKIGVVRDECVPDIFGRTPREVYEGYATKTSFIFFTSTCSPGQCCSSVNEKKIYCKDPCKEVCYNELGRVYDGRCAKADGYCIADANVCKDGSGKGVSSAHCECEGWTRKSPSSSPSPSP